MRSLLLKRITPKSSAATFGVLLDNDTPFAVTCELPWLGNERGVSCIPSGQYICHRIKRASTGVVTFVVMNIPGRSEILFHTGNTTRDSEGCIVIGEQYEAVHQPDGTSLPGVLSSAKGFAEFMQRYGKEKQFVLTVRWV